jgi:hypothetical protein
LSWIKQKAKSPSIPSIVSQTARAGYHQRPPISTVKRLALSSQQTWRISPEGKSYQQGILQPVHIQGCCFLFTFMSFRKKKMQSLLRSRPYGFFLSHVQACTNSRTFHDCLCFYLFLYCHFSAIAILPLSRKPLVAQHQWCSLTNVGQLDALIMHSTDTYISSSSLQSNVIELCMHGPPATSSSP